MSIQHQAIRAELSANSARNRSEEFTAKARKAIAAGEWFDAEEFERLAMEFNKEAIRHTTKARHLRAMVQALAA